MNLFITQLQSNSREKKIYINRTEVVAASKQMICKPTATPPNEINNNKNSEQQRTATFNKARITKMLI